MLDVIAIVGHQHGLLPWQDDNVTNIVFLHLELIHIQGVIK
ncbi:Uncharacterised protein [Yersinia enterocolitica]|nr:Uncharacterised protein [Yersinia enterocolitica]